MKTVIEKILVDKAARSSQNINESILASANEEYLQWSAEPTE